MNLGANIAKLYWNKFAHTFCKLDRFKALGQNIYEFETV